jgi:hypothetical protein
VKDERVLIVDYELTLEPDADRGGSRYRIAVDGDVAPGVVRQLSEWLGNAMQNPVASFEIDLTKAGHTSPLVRLELAALMRRHRSLVDERRLFVVARRRGRRQAVADAAVRPVGAYASMLAGTVPL